MRHIRSIIAVCIKANLPCRNYPLGIKRDISGYRCIKIKCISGARRIGIPPFECNAACFRYIRLNRLLSLFHCLRSRRCSVFLCVKSHLETFNYIKSFFFDLLGASCIISAVCVINYFRYDINSVISSPSFGGKSRRQLKGSCLTACKSAFYIKLTVIQYIGHRLTVSIVFKLSIRYKNRNCICIFCVFSIYGIGYGHFIRS